MNETIETLTAKVLDDEVSIRERFETILILLGEYRSEIERLNKETEVLAKKLEAKERKIPLRTADG